MIIISASATSDGSYSYWSTEHKGGSSFCEVEENIVFFTPLHLPDNLVTVYFADYILHQSQISTFLKCINV